MLIMCYHGEVMWQEFSGTGAACHHIDHTSRLDRKPENALGREKHLFREQTLKISSSFSGPGNEASHWADCLYAQI